MKLKHAYLVLLIAIAAMAGGATRPARGQVRPDQGGSCGTNNPMYAVAVYKGDATESGVHRSIVLANDTRPNDIGRHRVLARFDETGAVYGLAYDAERAHLYAGAGVPIEYGSASNYLGPGGTGAIYRLDLAAGTVAVWARLDAGTLSSGGRDVDQEDVGRVGLGDVELSEDGRLLFAVNLGDRRIYRFSVPDGAVLGSFAHGAAGEPWADNARPMGLGVRDGWLYHGMVDSREDEGLPGRLQAVVYRSAPDGTSMAEAVRFDLDYRTAPAWGRWREPIHEGIEGDPDEITQPLLADIVFRPTGDPVLGLRARGVSWGGGGDVLPTERVADGVWRAVVAPERYDDRYDGNDEATYGGLAAWPAGDGVVVGAFNPIVDPDRSGYCCGTAGLAWLSNNSGRNQGPADDIEALTVEEPDGIGDVEPLCPLGYPTATPSPTPLPTDTPPPSMTPTPSPSPTVPPTATPSPTFTPPPATATPERWRAYLPLAGREPCTLRALDIGLVLDMSSSMRRTDERDRTKHAAAVEAAAAFIELLDGEDRVAVVGFNDRAWIAQPLTADRAALTSGLAGLADGIAEGTRLDLALERGAEALAGRDPERTAVLVVLTDGLPNRVPPAEDGRPETTILRVAERVRADGIRLYVVGLGTPDDVYEPLLRQVADGPHAYRRAPDGAALLEIYRTLAFELRCDRG